MSLKKKAAQVRAAGHKNSRQDSMLAHITPREAMMLKMHGGSGRKDPKTGMPHFDVDSDTGGFSDAGYGAGYAGGYGDTTGGGFSGVGALSDIGMGDIGTGSYGDLGWDAVPLDDFSSLSDLTPTDVGNRGPVSNVQAGTPAAGFGEESSFTDQFGRRARDFALSQLGLPGMAVKTGMNMAASPSKGFGTLAGNTLGSILGGAGFGALGGPIGMAAGRGLSNAISAMEAGRPASGPGSTADIAAGARTNAGAIAGGDVDLGGVLTGLAGLYQGNKAAESSKQAAGLAQGQAQTLADLYGPNSPYAAQLRQQLERKDAAAGRRSQYGPREVELQARLADVASRNAPNVLAANQAAQGFRQQGQTTRGQQLAGALSLANKTGLTGMAQRGLQGLWSGGGGGSTGNEGFSLGGMSFNNPSAYVAPDTGGFEWPSAQGAYDYAAEVGNNTSSFWD